MPDTKTTWKDIWDKKSRVNNIVLECLVKADGFDSVAGSFSVEEWKSYVAELYSLIGIKKHHSIFDFGCGSGAFLFNHFLNGGNVGGVDYSSQLIGLAKGFMGAANFIVGDASEIKCAGNYDIVTSHSVFQYFDDLLMAENVLANMCLMAKEKIAILDINDESHAAIYHTERIAKFKENGLSENDYWDKYRDLEYLFYNKDFFSDFAIQNNLKIKISPQTNVHYGNSKLRFNVVFGKSF